jgi:hypothetical protein
MRIAPVLNGGHELKYYGIGIYGRHKTLRKKRDPSALLSLNWRPSTSNRGLRRENMAVHVGKHCGHEDELSRRDRYHSFVILLIWKLRYLQS